MWTVVSLILLVVGVPLCSGDVDPPPLRSADELVIVSPANNTVLYCDDLALQLATKDAWGGVTYQWEPFVINVSVTDVLGVTNHLQAEFHTTELSITLNIVSAPGPLTADMDIRRLRDGMVRHIRLLFDFQPHAEIVRAGLVYGQRFGGKHGPVGPTIVPGTARDDRLAQMMTLYATNAFTSEKAHTVAATTPSTRQGKAVREASLTAAAGLDPALRQKANPAISAMFACDLLPNGCDLPEFTALYQMFRTPPPIPDTVRPLPSIRNRLDIAAVLQAEGFKIGLEVGTQRGRFTEGLLHVWTNCELFFVVDPWEEQTFYHDTANAMSQSNNFRMTYRRLAPLGKVYFVPDYSVHASLSIPDGMLDFVYIDARHDFTSVTEDLETWWPKIRPGGILAGHDFLDVAHVAFYQGELPGTSTVRDGKRIHGWAMQPDGSVNEKGLASKGAVEAFAAKMGRSVSVTYGFETFPSWYMRR